MKILQTISDTDRRGAQVFAMDLGAALIERGHQVETRALVPGTNEKALDACPLASRRLQALWPLREVARGADVVVAHGSSTLIACAAVSLVSRTPFVYRQISDSRFWAASLARRLRVGINLRRARLTVALSPDAAHALEEHLRLPRARIRIVPNGVPARAFEPPTDVQQRAARVAFGMDPQRPTLTFAAALVPEKGADRVVRALAARADAQLLIAGDGPARTDLERLAARLAPGQVTFVGSLADVLPAYHAADAVVLPSLGGDSMPATLIEAGFCARPIIATDVGSIGDIVINGETGWLLPDDQARLDAAIDEVLDDPRRSAAMGRRARERDLATYEIAVVAEAWERVLIEAAS